MPGNELQYALIGLVAAVVIATLIYNFVQDRRARKHAQDAFKSTHRDVLLDEPSEEAIAPAPGGRMEPTATAEDLAARHKSASQSADRPAPTRSTRAPEPGVEWDMQAIDCVVAIDAPAGVSAPALFNAQQEMLAGVQRPLRWLGWSDSGNAWQLLNATTAGSFTRISAALQLADRRGVVSESELDRFLDQLQRLCDQFLAVPRLPAKAQVLSRAQELDRFSGDVDVQIAINIIADEHQFPGTKIRGLAEAAGMQLANDGSYVARDDAGRLLFALTNLEAAGFSVEQLRHLQTRGLTLSLDLPRIANPMQAFDRMVAFGEQLAEALGGRLVDDNRTPLSERAIGLIRGQAGQFEQIMERQNIPAGSELANRLFS